MLVVRQLISSILIFLFLIVNCAYADLSLQDQLTISMDEPASGIIVARGEVVTISWTGSGPTASSVRLGIDDDSVWDNGGDEYWLALSQPVSGSYSWNTHFMVPGTYHVVAVLTDGESEAYASAIVHVGQATTDDPIADFSAQLVPGQEVIAVAFTDLSQNSPAAWLWDFGDGETSQIQDPTHIYSESGDYRLSLTVENVVGTDVKTAQINVAAHPCANLLLFDLDIPYDTVMAEEAANDFVYLSVIGGDTPAPNDCGLNPSNDPDEWISWGGPIDADNAAIGGQPGERHRIVMGGVLYERGIGTHAEAEFTFDITRRNYLRFECYAGISDEEDSSPLVSSGENATCEFIFMVDGLVIAQTGMIRGYTDEGNVPPEKIEFDIPERSDELSIIITDGGDGLGGDLACLGDAKLIIDKPRELSISSVDASPGTSAVAELRIDNTVGMAGGDITIIYDASVLTIDEVRPTDLTSEMLVIPNIDMPGNIRLSMAGATGLPEGGGALVEIALTVSPDAQISKATILSFTKASIYDELGRIITMEVTDGSVNITQPGIKGDVNNDGKILSNDATLALRIAAQLMIPTEYQFWAADMNDDGAVRANDVTLILRKAAGLAAPGFVTRGQGDKETGRIFASQITVALGDAHGIAGERVSVPVWVDGIEMLSSGEICITYDNSVLRAVEVLSDSGLLLASNINKPGMLRIAFASPSRLNSQTIAEIQFEVLADANSPLKFMTARLYDLNSYPIDSGSIDREFLPWAMAPEHSALLQNFPNPFNPETWIPYQLAESSEVTFRIYSATGQLAKTIHLGRKEAGSYMGKGQSVYWDGRNEAGEQVSSGLYFCTIQAGEYTATRKMVVAK